jgi:iron complex transport system ATP-binding protein
MDKNKSTSKARSPNAGKKRRNLVEVTNLSFSYGENTVLDDISFSVEPNCLVAVLGINGTGKSTLIKCLNKINKIDSGRVKICGDSIDQLSINELAKLVAYVPQKVATSFPIDVYDVILLGRRPYINWNVSESDRKIVSSVIRKLSLEDFVFRKFHNLSGGEQQKAIVAKAIVQQPRVYLFDEPTSNLDLFNQYEILKQIKELVSDNGNPCSAIVAMHDINLASRFADKIMILHESKIFCYDEPRIVLNSDVISQVYRVDAEVNISEKLGKPVINILGPQEDK